MRLLTYNDHLELAPIVVIVVVVVDVRADTLLAVAAVVPVVAGKQAASILRLALT